MNWGWPLYIVLTVLVTGLAVSATELTSLVSGTVISAIVLADLVIVLENFSIVLAVLAVGLINWAHNLLKVNTFGSVSVHHHYM